MNIKKAVIPVAGLGIRFLPATKNIPKELFPIVDTPILLYVVQEAVEAGIEDIILITNENKKATEIFFQPNCELEEALIRSGKKDLQKRIKDISGMANVICLQQDKPKGLGDAVYCAKSVVGNQSFALLLGDEIMVSKGKNVISQLKDVHDKTQCSCVAVMEVEPSEVCKYGMVCLEDENARPMKIQSVVEKPSVHEAPSRWALPGRYIFTASVFQFLENLPAGKNGEIQLTDAMTPLAQKQGLYACPFVAKRYDAGDKFGYLQANIEMGLNHPEVGKKLRAYLKNLSLCL